MRCPRCGQSDLDPRTYDAHGMTTCQCGHRAYAGFVAEADALAGRLGWLEDRISAGDAPPDPGLRARYQVWPPPGAATGSRAAWAPGGVPAADAMGRSAAPAPSAQTILLGVGALLLVVAGAVFAAVVWDRLGAVGQVLVMVGATLGVGTLAIRLRTRLAGTAEALAVVAAGLAAIDLIAAPLLGLLPEQWLTKPTLYPAVAFSGLGIAQLTLHRRFGVEAWSWLGWAAQPLAGACVVAATAAATEGAAPIAAAVAVPALVSLGMLAAPTRVAALRPQRAAMQLSGTLGLGVSAVVTATFATTRTALPGALLTTAATTTAVTVWSLVDSHRLLRWGSSALLGITVALALALPADPQPAWLAAAAALAGVLLGLVLLRVRADRTGALLAAAAVWTTWAIQRVGATGELWPDYDVTAQLWILAALVALCCYVLALWMPAAGWIGAVLAMWSLILSPVELSAVVESYCLPLATLLLGAGLLWRRSVASSSLVWLGPAVAAALLPPAVVAWTAPWVIEDGSASTEHVIRLVGLLAAAVLAVVVGARLRMGGLLLPGACALVIVAGAQVFSGLAALPRWIALGLAGVTLVAAGARIEWLRHEGRRAVGWMEGLR